MKKLIGTLPLVIVISILTSCSLDQPNGDNQANQDQKTTSFEKPEILQQETSNPKEKIINEWSNAQLEFDNGLKWKANPETSEAIQDMDDAVDVFVLTEDHALDEYHSFADYLDAKYKVVFQVCKMRGPAHEELHKMLGKLNFYIQKMHSEDQDEAAKALRLLHSQLHLYSIYFE